MYMCVCVCVYIYIYIYIYIHTHIHYITYIHCFMFNLKMVSKSRNMWLYILKKKVNTVTLDHILLLYVIICS